MTSGYFKHKYLGVQDFDTSRRSFIPVTIAFLCPFGACFGMMFGLLLSERFIVNRAMIAPPFIILVGAGITLFKHLTFIILGTLIIGLGLGMANMRSVSSTRAVYTNTRSKLAPPPIYTTVFEGPVHERRFISTVQVNGSFYTSDVCRSRKASQQDAAKVALKDIKSREAPVAYQFLQDLNFSNSILNQYAAKMDKQLPEYSTFQSEGMAPSFTAKTEFDGWTCSGGAAKSKKEAEQLAAQAVIETLLGY